MESVLIIGISGVTCGGKTTLAMELRKLIPNITVLSQDDYYFDVKDPRHVWCKDQNHINFEIITGLDMERMLEDVKRIIGSKEIIKINQIMNEMTSSHHCHEFLKMAVTDKLKEKKVHLIILDGFILFAYKPLLPFIQLKYFFTLEQEECVKRRLDRTYEPPDIPGYFERCVWPEYLKHFEEVKQTVSNVIYFDSSVDDPLNVVLNDIVSCLT